ncbi:O-antigen ligase family protein [Desulfonatronovibrio hydrogenovorans]|uniref:O-antigen ligase family protein n=1 Tax=Desulfonatronovibrio hydrogenovorans TaxID=53245 RepID=UPI00048B6691|nr:O-antigen ligase family protein [Desulfonatronovibrio hydrogenovorans]
MLPLRTMAYFGLFSLAVLGAILYHPIVGIYAYLVTYNVNPLGQWWGGYLPDFATRYAFILAVATSIGVFLHWGKLRMQTVLERQEVLLILFLGVIWLSVLLGQGWGVHYNVIKMTKVVFIILLASRIITTFSFYEGMLWVLIISGLYLGFEMYSGSGVRIGGRFHAGVGGSDFGEGNFLAAHFAYVIPLIGALFLKGTWKSRGICLVSAVFILNAIVITRSRGAFLALGVGALAAIFLTIWLRGHRKKIAALMVLGVVGAVYLTDPGFWSRMETLQVSDEITESRDASAVGRLVAWRGAWEMAQDYPLGVGVNESFNFLGIYVPEMENRDIHNTYLRCLAELGFHGLLMLVLLIGNAFWMLYRIDGSAKHLSQDRGMDYYLHSFALKIAILVYLTAAIFISSVFIEEFYWLLMMPVFLKRALDNDLYDDARPGGNEA